MEFQFDPAKAARIDPLDVPHRQRYVHMRPEYDFGKAKRGAFVPPKGKTRITIYIDDAVLHEFRVRAQKAGTGYQTMINETLKAHLAEGDERPLTASVLRQVIREELPPARPRKAQLRGTPGSRR